MAPDVIAAMVEAIPLSAGMLPGVNGDAATAARFAGLWAESHGQGATPVQGLRIYEAQELPEPVTVRGRLRQAVAKDRELVVAVDGPAFDTTIVYVIVSPGTYGSGELVLATARSVIAVTSTLVDGVTGVVTSSDVTPAVFVTVAGVTSAPTSNVTVAVADAPCASEATVQSTTLPVVAEQSPAGATVTPVTASDASTRSLIRT